MNHLRASRRFLCSRAAGAAAALLLAAANMAAQSLPAQAADGRILGVIPNYATVDPAQSAAPLTVKQKWALFARETTDPFNLVGAVLGAGMSHADHGIPRYGDDKGAFGDRLGAAAADMTSQNFFSV